MAGIRPSTDVLPVTEFRANTSAMLIRMHASKRPVILTQHGRGAAVVMDVDVYERLLDEIDLLRDLRCGGARSPEARVSRTSRSSLS